MGYSLLFLGGLAEINARAPVQQRGGILSALYLFAYLALGTVAMILGVVATKWGRPGYQARRRRHSFVERRHDGAQRAEILESLSCSR
jgi:hypothetical protein